MSSQTRAVVIAFLTGIALVILLEASGAMTVRAGYIPPIDIYPLNADRSFRIGYWMAHWTVHWAIMGVIPLIFAAIAIASTAYKAGLRSSIFNALGAAGGVAVLSIVISGAQVAIAATYTMKELPFAEAGSARDGFVAGFMRSCAKTQQAEPENKDLSAADIDAFCSCSAKSLADVVTRDELAHIEQHKAAAASFAEKVNTASQKCTELTLGPQ